MTALIAWARDLVALALFGYLLELLLPSRVMEGYVRLVVGLVLLSALVSPLLTWLKPGSALGFDLPGASAQGVKAVLTDENRYASGEGSQILGVFSQQAAQAAEQAIRTVPGVQNPQVHVQVARDLSQSNYGQIEAVDVVLTVTQQKGALASRVRTLVAGTLGVPADTVEVRLLMHSRAGTVP